MAGSTRNPDRGLHRRLQDAANEVQRAVDHMLSDIDANKAYGTSVRDVSGFSATQRRKAEIEAQAKIMQAQRELELAQKELMALRKGRYGAYGPAWFLSFCLNLRHPLFQLARSPISCFSIPCALAATSSHGV